jgi:hypothetical protein
MKPRHAAALALVGWYLMCPPLCTSDWNGKETSCGSDGFNYDAPLDRWFKASEPPEFKSLRKCEISAAERSSEVLCKCVASDDPRLKEK